MLEHFKISTTKIITCTPPAPSNDDHSHLAIFPHFFFVFNHIPVLPTCELFHDLPLKRPWQYFHIFFIQPHSSFADLRQHTLFSVILLIFSLENDDP
jgi:FPC/CPF motif-containing protein YcgG